MQGKKFISLIICFFLFLFLFNDNLFAQYQQKVPWQQKLVLGGNIGIQWYGDIRIDLSPEIGYKVTDQFIPGIGVSYQYYYWKQFNISTSLYGSKLFARYYIYENVFGHAEFEFLSLESKVFDVQGVHGNDNRFWLKSLFVGGGYRQPIGQSSALIIMLLYNLNDSPDSPYKNPIIRFGIVF